MGLYLKTGSVSFHATVAFKTSNKNLRAPIKYLSLWVAGKSLQDDKNRLDCILTFSDIFEGLSYGIIAIHVEVPQFIFIII